MIVDGISLILGGIFGFIIGIALVKETVNNQYHKLKEEYITLTYEKRLLEMEKDGVFKEWKR